MAAEIDHKPCGGACSECSKPATHEFSESGHNGGARLRFCCGCYSLAVYHCHTPGRCSEQIDFSRLMRVTEAARR